MRAACWNHCCVEDCIELDNGRRFAVLLPCQGCQGLGGYLLGTELDLQLGSRNSSQRLAARILPAGRSIPRAEP